MKNSNRSFSRSTRWSRLSALVVASYAMSACIVVDGDDDDEDTTAGTTDGVTDTMGTGTDSSMTTGPTTGTETGSGTETGDTSNTGTDGTDTSTDGTGTDPMLGSCDRSAVPNMEASGAIESNTVWSGIVHVTSSVTVRDNAVLTIMPGTTVLAEPGTEIEVGWNSNAATLQAVGTADAPIHFCGVSPNMGSWGGIQIQTNVLSTSQLGYATIEDAGAEDYAALLVRAPIKIDTVSIKNSAGFGIEASTFGPGSVGLHVSGTAVPAHLVDGVAVDRFPAGSSLTGNVADVVELEFNNYSKDATLRDLGIPYRQVTDIDVRDGAKLRIAAGVVYEFEIDRNLEIGWNSNAASLFIEGEADRPVEFRARTGLAGGWHGLQVGRNVTTDSVIKNAVFRHGGGNDTHILSFQSKISLQNVVVEDSRKGVYIDEQGLASDSTMLSVRRVEDYPVEVVPTAMYTIPQGGEFVDNTNQMVLVDYGNLESDGTIPDLGIPYYILNSMTSRDGAKVTIAPGVDFVMGVDQSIEFGWNSNAGSVYAKGTADAPITFSGAAAEPGYWGSIIVGANQGSDSTFEFVEISDGGAEGAGLLELKRAINVSSSTLRDSAGYGIRRKSDDVTDYLTGNTFMNNALGDVGDL